MAGAPDFLLTGGMGAMPSLVSRPTAGSGVGAATAASQPHYGTVFLVALAVAVLFALDKLGFRFAVTAGRR